MKEPAGINASRFDTAKFSVLDIKSKKYKVAFSHKELSCIKGD